MLVESTSNIKFLRLCDAGGVIVGTIYRFISMIHNFIFMFFFKKKSVVKAMRGEACYDYSWVLSTWWPQNK